MNKPQMWQQLFIELKRLINVAELAANRAHETATNDGNVAENKYDTLGLEAAYLAHGQSQRLAQCRADLDDFEQLKRREEAMPLRVSLGCLVQLCNQNDEVCYFFIGPSAGGIKLDVQGESVLLITAQAPLGAKLLTTEVDDEVTLNIGDNSISYEVTAII
ncbi:MAG: GreA/GreB family elongation factor [Psychrobium sp.]|nr:GreA/GreB family elongation factor [Psychrobium sp.]